MGDCAHAAQAAHAALVAQVDAAHDSATAAFQALFTADVTSASDSLVAYFHEGLTVIKEVLDLVRDGRGGLFSDPRLDGSCEEASSDHGDECGANDEDSMEQSAAAVEVVDLVSASTAVSDALEDALAVPTHEGALPTGPETWWVAAGPKPKRLHCVKQCAQRNRAGSMAAAEAVQASFGQLQSLAVCRRCFSRAAYMFTSPVQ